MPRPGEGMCSVPPFRIELGLMQMYELRVTSYVTPAANDPVLVRHMAAERESAPAGCRC